jgi:hypothetical protein
LRLASRMEPSPVRRFTRPAPGHVDFYIQPVAFGMETDYADLMGQTHFQFDGVPGLMVLP